MRSTFPGFGVVTVFRYTVIPLDTSNCSTAMDCVPSSVLTLSQRFGNMLGGTAVHVSGPCFDEADNITCVFDGIPTDGMFFSERQYCALLQFCLALAEYPSSSLLMALNNSEEIPSSTQVCAVYAYTLSVLTIQLCV